MAILSNMWTNCRRIGVMAVCMGSAIFLGVSVEP